MKQTAFFLEHEKLQDLIFQLKDAGYLCVGPQVRNDAIVYDTLNDAANLPWYIKDCQEPGKYRLLKTCEKQAFAWTNGCQSLKPYLFKSRETICKVSRDEHGQLCFIPMNSPEKPIAFIGARACDIKAMLIQDRVFIDSSHNYSDPRYQQRRQQLFIVAVNCTKSSNNCFCVAAGGSPRVQDNFDIALTELNDGFVLLLGSKKGADIVEKLSLKKAAAKQIKIAEQLINNAIAQQTKKLNAGNNGTLQKILFNNLEHKRWSEVAKRCLSCGNCTLVCPTCFCHRQSDVPTLDGNSSEQIREWDSCFTSGHSVMAGSVLRDDTCKRYRQWLTHKLGSWHEQFATSGCVGCGRCITWCPVGIDITEEVNAISSEVPKDE